MVEEELVSTTDGKGDQVLKSPPRDSTYRSMSALVTLPTP